MTKSNFFMGLAFVVFLTMNMSVTAETVFDGTKYWEEDAYVMYEETITLQYNRDLTLYGEMLYDYTSFPDIQIDNAQIKISFISVFGEDMRFEVTTSNTLLQDFLLNGLSSQEAMINSKTAKLESGEYTGLMFDTSNFENQRITDFEKLFYYGDDDDVETKNYKVISDRRSSTVKIGSTDKSIEVWDLEISAYEIEWFDSDFQYMYTIEKQIRTVTDIGGVSTFIQEGFSFSLNDLGDEDYILAFQFDRTRELDSFSDGVNVVKKDSDNGPLPANNLLLTFSAIVIFSKMKTNKIKK